MRCILCKSEMEGPHRGYWFECHRCGFLSSQLSQAIGDRDSHASIDETYRRQGLYDLRLVNFERILDQLQQHCRTRPATLLDVGCAFGWFLRAASRRGYVATGLEPDPAIAAQAREQGLSVIFGFFPNDVPLGERFDVITFHDVFEHVDSPHDVVAACFERLNPGGLLVLNVPSSRGIFFRLARLFSRFGASGPLDRMWQRGFPSPHVSYFHPAILADLLQTHGFREVHRNTLPSLTRNGLWQRLRYDRRSSSLISAVQWLALGALCPVLWLFPADISLQIFKRVETQQRGGIKQVGA